MSKTLMLLREHRRFAEAPTALLYRDSLERSSSRGCVLCYHGLGSSKDAWLHDLEAIAARGLLAVGVDAVGHGDRRYGDFESRFSQANPDFGKNFIGVVKASAKELPQLVDALAKEGLAQGPLGILGVSMGGFIAYRAVLEEPKLRAAATLVASPEWWMCADPDSPHLHPGGFNAVHLLSQTAARDAAVPSAYAQRFHETLETLYSDYHERFAYQTYSASDHSLNPDWPLAWTRAADWLEARLQVAHHPPL